MSAKPIEAVVLPAYLNRNTPMNLFEESPRYVSPDFIYINEVTNGLFLYGDDRYPKISKDPKALLGTVGIMRVAVVDPETDGLVNGFVADLRFIESADRFEDAAPDEAPDDQEDFNEWQQDKLHEIPIAAVAYKGLEEGETAVSGDSRFASAVMHLARLADELDKKLHAEHEEKKKLKETKSVAKDGEGEKNGQRKVEDRDQTLKGLSVDK